LGSSGVRVYPNSCVERVVAFIPPGHRHVRFLVEFCDGLRLLLQEATVAGIVRAYAATAIHPTRRCIELVGRDVGGEAKPGFARHQLLESGRECGEVLEEVGRLLGEGGSSV